MSADDRRVLRAAAVQQGVDDVAERDRARADGEAQQDREAEDARARRPGRRCGCTRPPRTRAATDGGRGAHGRQRRQLGDPNHARLLGCPNSCARSRSHLILLLAAARCSAPAARRRLRRPASAAATRPGRARRLPGHHRAQVRHDRRSAEPKRVVVAGLREQDALLALGVVPSRPPSGSASTPARSSRGRRTSSAAPSRRPSSPRPTGCEIEKIAAQRPDLILAVYSGHDQEGVRGALEDRPGRRAADATRSTTARPGRRRR